MGLLPKTKSRITPPVIRLFYALNSILNGDKNQFSFPAINPVVQAA